MRFVAGLPPVRPPGAHRVQRERYHQHHGSYHHDNHHLNPSPFHQLQPQFQFPAPSPPGILPNFALALTNPNFDIGFHVNVNGVPFRSSGSFASTTSPSVCDYQVAYPGANEADTGDNSLVTPTQTSLSSSLSGLHVGAQFGARVAGFGLTAAGAGEVDPQLVIVHTLAQTALVQLHLGYLSSDIGDTGAGAGSSLSSKFYQKRLQAARYVTEIIRELTEPDYTLLDPIVGVSHSNPNPPFLPCFYRVFFCSTVP